MGNPKDPTFKGFTIDPEALFRFDKTKQKWLYPDGKTEGHPIGIETLEDARDIARDSDKLAWFILKVAKEMEK